MGMYPPAGAYISVDGQFYKWAGTWRYNTRVAPTVESPDLLDKLEYEYQTRKAKANMGCDSGPSYSDIVKSEPSALAGPPEHNVITHPKHYTNKVPPTDKHPNGIECYEVIMWFPTMVGSAIKYLWRAGDKDDELQDLRKAKQFIDFRIEQIEQQRKHEQPEPQRREPA